MTFKLALSYLASLDESRVKPGLIAYTRFYLPWDLPSLNFLMCLSVALTGKVL